MTTTWLPASFHHPRRVEWGDSIHLRPIRAADVDIDMPAVMVHQAKLWQMYGDAWGWPPPSMTREQDVADLQHHVDEMERQASFNYAILPDDESELYGCMYIDPVTDSVDSGPEAEVSWWLTDTAPAALHRTINERARGWIRDEWPVQRVRTPFNTA